MGAVQSLDQQKLIPERIVNEILKDQTRWYDLAKEIVQAKGAPLSDPSDVVDFLEKEDRALNIVSILFEDEKDLGPNEISLVQKNPDFLKLIFRVPPELWVGRVANRPAVFPVTKSVAFAHDSDAVEFGEFKDLVPLLEMFVRSEALRTSKPKDDGTVRSQLLPARTELSFYLKAALWARLTRAMVWVRDENGLQKNLSTWVEKLAFSADVEGRAQRTGDIYREAVDPTLKSLKPYSVIVHVLLRSRLIVDPKVEMVLQQSQTFWWIVDLHFSQMMDQAANESIEKLRARVENFRTKLLNENFLKGGAQQELPTIGWRYSSRPARGVNYRHLDEIRSKMREIRSFVSKQQKLGWLARMANALGYRGSKAVGSRGGDYGLDNLEATSVHAVAMINSLKDLRRLRMPSSPLFLDGVPNSHRCYHL